VKIENKASLLRNSCEVTLSMRAYARFQNWKRARSVASDQSSLVKGLRGISRVVDFLLGWRGNFPDYLRKFCHFFVSSASKVFHFVASKNSPSSKLFSFNFCVFDIDLARKSLVESVTHFPALSSYGFFQGGILVISLETNFAVKKLRALSESDYEKK